MYISIPNTGYDVGTCGWLAKGLADGSINIQPGTSTGGKGGLWIHTPIGQGCLAIFNEFDLSDWSHYGADRFGVVSMDFGGSIPLTDAAERYLREIARDWCRAANEWREKDGATQLPILVVAE